MRNKTIIILIALVVLGIVAYYFIPNQFGWKTYTNEKYGYSLKYPNDYSAFEWPELQRDEKPYLVETVGTKDSVLLTTNPLVPGIMITHENGTAFISGSNTVDDFWSKLGKVDHKGDTVNIFLKKESINGVVFIVLKQKSWDTETQSDLWTLQTMFMHNNNFFWVSSSPQNQDVFYTIIRSFEFSTTKQI